MSQSENLTLEDLRTAVAGSAAAFRSVTRYQPAGGPGDKVFPPTYEGATYALEHRRIEGKERLCVVLDSVPSQANRAELAILRAWEEGRLSLPVISVDFSEHFPDLGKVSTLEAPHRIADAIFRYNRHQDGTPFGEGPIAEKTEDVSPRNATSLFEVCPTALLFGTWGTPKKTGGLSQKFERAFVSEIIGVDVVPGVRTSSRLDGLDIRGKVELYEARDDVDAYQWTLREDEAKTSKKGKSEKPETLKPSEVNLGNVTPSAKFPDDDGNGAAGGVTIDHAVQFTVVSLPVFRRLQFPLNGKASRDSSVATRTVLAALGLLAGSLAREEGASLRSRCHLVPDEEPVWELLDRPGQEPRRFGLDGEGSVTLFREALDEARGLGLPWMEEELVLAPSQQMLDLIGRSRALQESGGE